MGKEAKRENEAMVVAVTTKSARRSSTANKRDWKEAGFAPHCGQSPSEWLPHGCWQRQCQCQCQCPLSAWPSERRGARASHRGRGHRGWLTVRWRGS